jgi:glycosyltransferase involved in cell wall biosynthesis
MNSRPEILIVIPCYNEAARLPIDQLCHFLAQSEVRFVFVNDGSTDATETVLTRLRAGRNGRVSILSLARNCGKAEAVRRGIIHCLQEPSDYVGFWDADLATPLAAIDNFVSILEMRPEIDMVFGARVKLLGRKIERRPTRHYLGRVFATFVSSILRLPIYDTQCGAKLFRVKPELQRLFDEPFQSRWVFDVEMIARYIRSVGSPKVAAGRIYEYPLHTWEDVRGSKVKAIDFISAFKDVVRIYWKHMRVIDDSALHRTGL